MCMDFDCYTYIYINVCLSLYSFIWKKDVCSQFLCKNWLVIYGFLCICPDFQFPVFNARTLYVSLQKFVWIDSTAVKASHKNALYKYMFK